MDESFRLHYEEEKYIAQKLLQLPPFSEERKILLNRGYELITDIMKWRNPNASSMGASDASAGLVCKFLVTRKDPVTLYEAGVGYGLSADMFMKYPNVSMKGCDVVIQAPVKELMRKYPGRLSVDEATLYDSLKGIEDGSIDIFYADNVIEHMFPDEFPAILELLSRKLKVGALLFMFIPNSISGPHDISHRSLKMGQKAEGFHFMEMTYREVTEKFMKYGIVHAYLIFKTLFKNYRCIKDSSGILNRVKVAVEPTARIIPAFARKQVMAILGYSTYIMIKN